MSKEVVVTGVGMVTPLGGTAEECFISWRDGASAIFEKLPELEGTPLENERAARMPQIDAASRLGSRKMLKYMSGSAVLGCIAAREAIHSSGIKERVIPDRIGLFAGSGLAAANVEEIQNMVKESISEDGGLSLELLGKRGLGVANPLLSFKILANMPPCLISIIEGLKGPNLIFTPWEGHTGAAILEGWKAVAEGEADCALVGAAETAGHPVTLAYLRQAGHLRVGERPASGAAYIVLERLEQAVASGARILCRIKDIRIENGSEVSDPLSLRIGRTFAAAPAILFGLASLAGDSSFSICGVDGQTFGMELRAV